MDSLGSHYVSCAHKQLAPVFPGVGHKRGKFQLSKFLPLLRWPDSTVKTRDMSMTYQFQIPNVRQGATPAPNEEDLVSQIVSVWGAYKPSVEG